MLKITFEREKIEVDPKLEIGKNYYEKIGEVVKASILRNIASQTQVDGTRIKPNAPSTREKKRRAGRPQLSLVDIKHRFTKPSNWKVTATENQVTIEPMSELADLNRNVQEMGYRGWMGLNKDGVKLVRQIIRNVILKWARKRSRALR